MAHALAGVGTLSNARFMPCYAVGRPNSLRSSCLAAFNTRFRSTLKFFPPRLISKFSIDIAERNGVDLRRELRSADFFKERASARGLLSLKTPDSRSKALLVLVTFDDHRLAEPRARVAGFFAAIEDQSQLLIARCMSANA
jgi:hypothetical protein